MGGFIIIAGTIDVAGTMAEDGWVTVEVAGLIAEDKDVVEFSVCSELIR
jgi:hypothetical protein